MKPHQSIIKDTALRTWIAFMVVVGGSLLLLFLYSVRTVLLELIIGIVLAIALTPIVRFLMRHHFNRPTASIVTILITLLVLLGIIAAIASPLISQSNDLVKSIPQLVTKITASPFVKQLDSQFHLADKIKKYSQELPSLLSASSGSIISAVKSVFDGLAMVAIILIFTLFLLMEGPEVWRTVGKIAGPKRSVMLERMATKIQRAVGGFVTGNLFISLIAGVVALLSLLFLRVPYAFALAALVALFDLIPLVGAILATVILALVALTNGILAAIIIIVIMFVYQEVEGHIIQPLVYGKSLKLSQLLIIVSTIIGALLGGVIGVLLAIPVASVVVIIISEILQLNGVNVEEDEEKVLGEKK